MEQSSVMRTIMQLAEALGTTTRHTNGTRVEIGWAKSALPASEAAGTADVITAFAFEFGSPDSLSDDTIHHVQ